MPVIPVLPDLRNVPALSNRLPLTENVKPPPLWSSNSPLPRLVITPPLKRILPAPVQSAAPAFSNTRLKLTAIGTAMFSVAPGAMIVRPPPFITPAVQFIALFMVTISEPPSAPLLRSRFSTAIGILARKVAPLILYKPLPLSWLPGLMVKVPEGHSTEAVAGALNWPLVEPPPAIRFVAPGKRLTDALLVNPPLHKRVPVWISTVLKLFSATVFANVVVPAFSDFRRVPALSKRPGPKEELKAAAFWTSNSAPARFVITAPVLKLMLPPPDHVAVPAFSRARVVMNTDPGPI